MTSMMPPTVYATQLATKAQQSLQSATAALNGDGPVPFNRIGIPEENGPDSPDNPWFVNPVQRPFAEAARHATTAISYIDSVLELGATDRLARDVLAAFSSARAQASHGVLQLTAKSMRPVDPRDVALKFDGASLWLGLAKNLIALHDGPMIHPRPPVVIRPPVTILPVDPPVGPGEPGSPITIQPIGLPEVEAPEAMQPITIQLPSPDSEIQ